MKKLYKVHIEKNGKKLLYKICHDQYAGFYIYGYDLKTKNSICDYLQDDLDAAFSFASDKLEISRGMWEKTDDQ